MLREIHLIVKKFPLKDCEQNIKDDCKCSVKFPECNRAGCRQASTPSPAPAPAVPAPGPSPSPAAAPAPVTITDPLPAPKCPKDLQNVVDETNVSISFSQVLLS